MISSAAAACRERRLADDGCGGGCFDGHEPRVPASACGCPSVPSRASVGASGGLEARPVLPPHAPGMRIGLFGGTFDPPHAAHRGASLLAMKRIGLDRVWWLVTPGNPLKEPAVSQRSKSASSPRGRWPTIRAST